MLALGIPTYGAHTRARDRWPIRIHGKQATVYQSEVKAIKMAAELALKMKRGPCKCNIWLDNQAAIYELGKHDITQKCVLDAHNMPYSNCVKMELGKCRMCETSVEEPAHIIKDCKAFSVERFKELGCLEWHTDTEWNVDQMMHFLQ